MKTIAQAVIIIFIFIAGFLFGTRYAGMPAGNADQAAIGQCNFQASPEMRASLKLDFGNNDIRSFDNIVIQKDQTVFDILKKVTEANGIELKYRDYGGDMGVFVESIGSRANDAKANMYWQYYINGSLAQTGPGSYKLTGSETIEWKYVASQF